jgi:hypothetical protein
MHALMERWDTFPELPALFRRQSRHQQKNVLRKGLLSPRFLVGDIKLRETVTSVAQKIRLRSLVSVVGGRTFDFAKNRYDVVPARKSIEDPLVASLVREQHAAARCTPGRNAKSRARLLAVSCFGPPTTSKFQD